MTDSKITQLTEDTSPLTTYLFVMVQNPGTTPATVKVVASNVAAAILAYTNSLTEKSAFTLSDELVIYDVANSVAKKVTLSNFLLDEDNMSSDSATKGATQQSIKAYSDSATQTMTNKRITKRSVTVTVAATPTINTDNGDIFRIGVTGDLLDLAITSMTTNLSGAPTHGQMIAIEFLDDGTGRAITWGASFRSTDIGTLPTTTTASKLLRVLLMYDSADSIWECVGVSEEA